MDRQLVAPPQCLEDVTFPLNGETVHRITAEYCGHVVQVLQYDESPLLVVCIGDDVQQVDISELESHITRMTGR